MLKGRGGGGGVEGGGSEKIWRSFLPLVGRMEAFDMIRAAPLVKSWQLY